MKLSTNELNFRLNSAIGYCYGLNKQSFINYYQITKVALDLEETYDRYQLETLCQTENIDRLHEIIRNRI